MVELKVYSNPKIFYSEVTPVLYLQESKYCLLLGLAKDFQFDGKDCLYQAACFQEGELLGAVMLSHYSGNYNLIVTETTKKIAQVILDDFLDRDIKLTGVAGDSETADIYKEALELKGFTTQGKMEQGIYACKKLVLPELQDSLLFQTATLDHLDLISKWIKDFYTEAVPENRNFDSREVAKNKIEKGQIHLLFNGSRHLSMVAKARELENSCTVNLVYTPKAYRKQGFGSLVTALMTRKLFESGKNEVNLYTDMSNPTSNKIYQAIGYEFVCNSTHYHLFSN